MINNINSNTKSDSSLINLAVPEQKLNNRNDMQVPIVERKQEVSSAREEIPREEVERATDKLNKMMGIIDKRLKFAIHEKSERVMIEVIDQESGNVINEFPPKQLLDFLGSFRELVGMLVDKHI